MDKTSFLEQALKGIENIKDESLRNRLSSSIDSLANETASVKLEANVKTAQEMIRSAIASQSKMEKAQLLAGKARALIENIKTNYDPEADKKVRELYDSIASIDAASATKFMDAAKNADNERLKNQEGLSKASIIERSPAEQNQVQKVKYEGEVVALPQEAKKIEEPKPEPKKDEGLVVKSELAKTGLSKLGKLGDLLKDAHQRSSERGRFTEHLDDDKKEAAELKDAYKKDALANKAFYTSLATAAKSMVERSEKLTKEAELKLASGDEKGHKVMTKRAKGYAALAEKLSDDACSFSEKRGIMRILSNPKWLNEFMDVRKQTEKWDAGFVQSFVSDASEKIAKFGNDPRKFDIAKAFESGLLEKRYRLLESFAIARTTVPGAGNIRLGTDIDAFIAENKEFLSEKDIENAKELQKAQMKLREFESVKAEYVAKFEKDGLVQIRLGLENEKLQAQKFRESELAKIDAEQNMSDDAKASAKSAIERGFDSRMKELAPKEAWLKETEQKIEAAKAKITLTTEELDRASDDMDYYSLTAQPQLFNNAVAAVARDINSGDSAALTLDLDVASLHDSSLIEIKEEKFKTKRAEYMLKRGAAIATTIFGKKGETNDETKQRYEKLDNFFKGSEDAGSGIFVSGISMIVVSIFKSLDAILKWIENVPVLIMAAKEAVKRNALAIYGFVVAALSMVLLVSDKVPDKFLLINPKFYLMGGSKLDVANGCSYSFTDPKWQEYASKLSLFVFMVSLIVIYQIMIEFLGKYTDFIKNPTDNGKMSGFILSLIKTLIIIAVFGLLFQVNCTATTI